jgi:hypothetical protein
MTYIDPADQPILCDLPEASGDLADAWTELFRAGIRYARIARHRAASAASVAASQQTDKDQGAQTQSNAR